MTSLMVKTFDEEVQVIAKKARVLLLDDGGFSGFIDTQFPIEAEGLVWAEDSAVTIQEDELLRIGYDVDNYLKATDGRTFNIPFEARILEILYV